MLVKLDLVSEETTDATEAFHELETFLWLVSDEFNLDTEASVVVAEPLGQGVLLYNVVVLPAFLVFEVFCQFFLGWVQKNGPGISLDRVLEDISVDFQVLKEHHSLQSTYFHSFHCVFNTKDNETSIEGDLLEEFAD